MKYFFTLLFLSMITVAGLKAQTTVYHEDFEQPSGADSVTHASSSATNLWGISTSLSAGGQQSDSARCTPNDTLTLTTNSFSTTGNAYVILDFDHISKIEALDKGVIEVSTDNGATWSKLDTTHYMGNSSNFGSSGNVFNATSYGSDWNSGNATATPDNTWWKHETFNISAIAGNQASVQIRFSLIDGNGGTVFENYGWFLDNIAVEASPSEMIPPQITMIQPIIQDTVIFSLPQSIRANITDNSGIDTAYVVYYVNGVLADTLGMVNTTANQYEANIPFVGFGRTVTYFIKAIDLASQPNEAASNNYTYYLKYVAGALQNLALEEDFNAGNIPSNWSTSGTVWSHETGATSSTSTGPSGPYEGSGYVYTEASGGSNTTDELTSPSFDISNHVDPRLIFSYHMYGAAMGSLSVEIYDGSAWQQIWTISGQQHASENDPWTRDTVSLQSYQNANAQIRFVGATGSSYTSDMAVDFVQIGDPVTGVMNDAGVKELTYPYGGVVANSNFDVKATVKNFGSNVLSSFDLGWTLDGTPQPTYSWSGSLPADSVSSEITLGTRSVSQGPHSLKLWTTDPNDTADFNFSNDTLQFDFYGCTSLLSGTYTIGGSNPDYNTFSDAVLALMQCGISGPVTFNVASGTYNEQISLGAISGVSATDTIVFQSLTSDSTAVTLQYDASSSSDNYVVELLDAGFVTFKTMTFKSLNTTFSAVMRLGQGTHHLNLTNNQFIGHPLTAGTGGNDSSLVITEDSVGSHIYFLENRLIDGGKGLDLLGNNSSDIKVEGNIFVDQWSLSMRVAGAVNPSIKHNKINTNSTYDSYNGVLIENIDGPFEIAYNELYAPSTAIGYGFMIMASAGDSLNHARVFNNMIVVSGTLGSNTLSCGIINYESKFIDYSYNTVKMAGDDQNTPALCLYDVNLNQTKGIELRNNIFSNFANGYVMFTQNVDTSAYTADYNNYYADGSGDFAILESSVVNNFTELQVATGEEDHSINLNPYFSSPTDLHVANNLMNGSGVPVSGISDDIDGEIRNQSTPDIGADEFDPSPYDIAVIDYIAPTDGCGLDSTENVTIQIKNVGSASVDTLTASYKIDDPNASVVTENIYSTLSPGDTLEYTFNQTINLDITWYGQDSTFQMLAWGDYASDPIPNNDSIHWSVKSLYEPLAPIVSDTTINYGDSVILTAISNDTLLWYAYDSSSTELYQGNYFTTPNLFDSTTYWVEAVASTTAPVIITEFSANPDAVEVMNISGAPFDATGWQVIVSDNNTDINIAEPQTWTLGQFQTDEVIQGNENSEFGSVGWVAGWNIWIMLLDDQGNIVDFATSGWPDADIQSMSINAGGFTGLNPVLQNQWTGAGSTAGENFSIRQYADNDDATDWINSASGSLGFVNPNLVIGGGSASGCPSPRVPLTVHMNSYPSLDAGIAEVISPKGSVPSGIQQAVKVALHNYGQNNLQSVDIHYAINGQLQGSYNWSGNIPFQGTDTVTVDSLMFSGGVYTFDAWTTQPNGSSDPVHGNDTAYASFNACMSGFYTIGDTTGGNYYDFLSFNQALSALNTATVCGDITLEVASDIYYETLEINEIPGVDSLNTVTFTSISGDSTDVILEGAPGSSTSGVLFLNEADYISFSHMTIRVSPTATNGRTVYFDGEATHNKLLNCVVETQANTSSYFSALYSSGTDDHYNVFKNNHFRNGYYTIYWRGSSTNNPKKSTIFEGNIIEGFYYYGLYLYYNDSIMVKNNKFYNRLNSGTNYAMYSYYAFNGFEIGNNEFIINDPTDGGTKYGMRLYYSNYYPYYDPSDAPGLVYNNMIYINNTGSKYGIYSYYNNDVKFYYNTINLAGNSGYTTRPLYQNNSSSNTEGETFINNIFIDSIGGHAAYFNTPATIKESNYNNYYTVGNSLAYWNGNQATLADLQNASGMDTNSVTLLPQFEAAGNLRLADLQLAEKGIAVPEVTRDIDGKLRSAPSTTIGAHERYLVPIDVGVAEILSPKDSIKANQPHAVAALIKNYGTDTIHTFDVKYSINNSGDVTTTYNGMIPPMQTDTVFFADTVISTGHHSLCFSTVLSTDTMTFNDQICGSYYGIPPYDIGIVALNSPDSGVCYTSSELIIVKLVNYGYQNLNMINNPVDIHVNVSGPNPQTFPVTTINTNILPASGSQNVQVASNYDMSQSGLYTFHASADVAVDGDTANNAMIPQEIEVNATITSFPFFEDFESFIPGNGSSYPGDFQNGWSSSPNVLAGEFQWYANTGSTPSSNTGPPGDHTKDDGSGNYMYAESNYGNFQQRAMFISPCLDLGSLNNPVLRFWYFMHGSQVYSLRVDVNDGSGWQNSVGYVIGQQQYSQNAAWEQKVVDLSAFAGDIVRLRFRAIRGPGIYGDIAIDDVMIYEPQPVELAVKAIHAPTVEHGLVGSMEQVEVEIESLGLDTVDIFDIGFYAADMQPVMETWTGSLNPFQTIAVTFSSPYQIQKGNDPLKVFVTHPSDKNKSNDTAYYHITGFATENIPWFDDFEGDDWWRGLGQSSQWERGIPSAITINTPFSGSNVWAINLDGNYASNASDLLYSPYFDFSSVQGATLEFQHWYESEQDHDGGFIQYTQSFGNSWQSLGVMNDPLGTNWYNSSNGAMHIWSGSSGGWIKSTFDLSQFDNSPSPVQFRFAYTADVNNSNYDGWAIDNFNIRLPKISQDAGVVQILAPSFYANANGQHVRVKVVNYGTNALTSIPLEYTVNGANTVSETWTGNLQPGDTIEYAFNATLNVPSAAAFELCVSSDVSGDSNTFNDVTCKNYAFDAGVKYIMNPLLISFKDDSLQPAVMIHNFGSDTIYSLDVYYRVKNDPAVTETWNGVLAPGENQQYIFNQSFVSPAGLYQICAGTDLAGDTESNNDESCKYATGKEHGVGIDNISATADFEVGPCQPNPADEYTLIPVDLKQPASLQFRLYNLTGKELIRRNHDLPGGRSDIRLDVNNLSAGMYYYRIASGDHTVTGKVVIQR